MRRTTVTTPETGTGDVIVRLDGVARTYPGPPPVRALAPTDLVIRRGEHIAVVGPSGAGKSTLLHVIGLLDVPTEGRLSIEGVDTADMPDVARTQLRGRRIGFVFQEFHLLGHRTALENVTLAMAYANVARRQRLTRAAAVLDRVGLAERRHALPSQMSGGERQRVAIARALAVEPAVLLCDEPTGNLDSASSAGVLDLLGELHHAGHTLVVVTHDGAVAERAARVLTVRDGQVHDGASERAGR